MKRQLFCHVGILVLAVFFIGGVMAQEETGRELAEYKANFEPYRARLDALLKERGLVLADYHVHVMKGGQMTPDAVGGYAAWTGLDVGMVENAGREWLLSDNEKIAAYLDEAEKAAYAENPKKKAFLIGIQVNDRDWFRVISPENLKRLDYVLADTLVMTKPDGTPQPLWELPADYNADPEEWMKGYFAHCLNVLDEPITIWADPLYLPVFCRDQADRLWTEDRVAALVDKAVKNHIAIEIQGPSSFPLDRLVRIGLAKGAKFCLGTNNFDDKPKSLENWIWFFDHYDIQNDQLLHLTP